MVAVLLGYTCDVLQRWKFPQAKSEGNTRLVEKRESYPCMETLYSLWEYEFAGMHLCFPPVHQLRCLGSIFLFYSLACPGSLDDSIPGRSCRYNHVLRFSRLPNDVPSHWYVPKLSYQVKHLILVQAGTWRLTARAAPEMPLLASRT